MKQTTIPTLSSTTQEILAAIASTMRVDLAIIAQPNVP